jgi:serine acetyltransferase
VVEHDAMIGASSLVCENVPAFATVLGVPATIINMKGSVDYIIGARSRAPARAAASGLSGQVSRFPEPRIRAGE